MEFNAAHFDMHKDISFNSLVKRVFRNRDDDKWQLDLVVDEEARVEKFDKVAFCHGYQTRANMPAFEGAEKFHLSPASIKGILVHPFPVYYASREIHSYSSKLDYSFEWDMVEGRSISLTYDRVSQNKHTSHMDDPDIWNCFASNFVSWYIKTLTTNLSSITPPMYTQPQLTSTTVADSLYKSDTAAEISSNPPSNGYGRYVCMA